MPILQTTGLEKRFGGIVATSNVNLSVEKGARHALIGPNGAGKTTFINLLTGALLTQTTAFCSLDVFSLERSADLLLVLIIGGTGYLYGGLIGAVVFRMLQELFQMITPQYWLFWIGLVLVVIVLIGRARLHRWVLFVPNLIIRQFAGNKAAVAVPESDAS